LDAFGGLEFSNQLSGWIQKSLCNRLKIFLME
jgi:hypothetical protein